MTLFDGGTQSPSLRRAGHFKDEVLDHLAREANVAQFVSFGPGDSNEQRFSRVYGYEPNHRFENSADAIESLLQAASDGTVNIRSFKPYDPRSQPFTYGISSADRALREIKSLAGQGLYTIVNETIDIHDGGVSGVYEHGIMEFAPDDTPRFVEHSGECPVLSLPKSIGLGILETVYGFRPSLDYGNDVRIEFSIHPKVRGWRRTHTLIWERQRSDREVVPAKIAWPNTFSQKIGDKTFGLLIASEIGLQVPRCVAVLRHMPPSPFVFGEPTGAKHVWTRTCPRVKIPGRFTTTRSWVDPHMLMDKEDPEGNLLAACLLQDDIQAVYSGSLATSPEGDVEIQGVQGYGDRYMEGQQGPDSLPDNVRDEVESVQQRASKILGPVEMEWVFDGMTVWVLQLHARPSSVNGNVIVPGEPSKWRTFEIKPGDAKKMLNRLRLVAEECRTTGEGVEVIGHVGVTSHIAHILSDAGVPSRIRG